MLTMCDMMQGAALFLVMNEMQLFPQMQVRGREA